MKGIGRAALVVTIFTAGFFVLAEASPGNPLVRTVGLVAHTVAEAAGAVADRFGNAEHGEAQAAHRTQAPAQGEEFEWTGRLSAGQALEIKGVNGPVIAEVAEGNEIRVRAEKRSRRGETESVWIDVVEHSDGVTLCSVYPSREGRENYCAPGDEGRMNVRNVDVQVTFHVEVPEGVEFVAKTVNGDVEIAELRSDVRASTVNGSVEVETTGFAHARTVNGSIEALMGTIDPEGMDFSTVNGSILLDIPDDLDADIDASWVNGGLETAPGISLVGRIAKRSADARMGAGGPEIELKTVNGSIRIR